MSVAGRTQELNTALESLHFGFRSVVAGPDKVLAKRGLGRVHHRVLYFIGRSPGLAVGELCRILGVSKQALNAPLRDLLARRLVRSTVDPANRRRKLLSLTPAGVEFEHKLSDTQRERMAVVFAEAGRDAEQGWRTVMKLLAQG